MRIVAYKTSLNSNQVLIEESTGERIESDKLDTLFSFLLEQFDEKGEPVQTIKVCWNLNDTVAPILRLMGKEKCQRLHDTHKCFCRPFNIFYIPDKVFSVMHIPSKYKLDLYGIDQYYPELNNSRTVEEVEYLGLTLLNELHKMNLYPNKLTSPVAIYEQCVMSHLDLPAVADMPKEAGEMAWLCSGKLWIEAHTLGHFEKAYDYDIIASFPTVAANLTDIRHCDWIQADHYIEGAVYGYVKCVVTIFEETQVSPIIYIDEQGNSSCPVGTWETYLTKGELDFILKWKIGKWAIIDGWWAMSKRKGTLPTPLKIPMERLLAYKEKTGLQAMLAKRMSVGVYGKFGEERENSFGPHFCPAWFTEISTQVRLQVAEFIYKHKLQPHIVHISVDGILISKEVKL